MSLNLGIDICWESDGNSDPVIPHGRARDVTYCPPSVHKQAERDAPQVERDQMMWYVNAVMADDTEWHTARIVNNDGSTMPIGKK